MRRYFVRGLAVSVGLVVVPSVVVWRAGGADAVEAVQGGPNGRTTVRRIAAGERVGGNPGQKGATYYALAGRTRRLTARFGSVVAVAEPAPDGDIRATLSDAAGQELGRLTVNHVNASEDVVLFTRGTAPPFQARGEPGVTMTLDWANRQLYALVADDIDPAGDDLEWRNGFIRRRGAAARDVEREIRELETEWTDGLSAITAKSPAAPRRVFPDRHLTGELVATRLMKDGQQVGRSNWYPREQVFTWDLPGLTKGAITARELAVYGGWPFSPDLEWMNVQAIAFHYFKSLINQQRFVAGRRSGWVERAFRFFAPVLEANEAGCDNLHWLDGTLFRYCCDIHDACYEKYGCSASSWWKVWSSWRCDACNAAAIFCFADAADGVFQVY